MVEITRRFHKFSTGLFDFYELQARFSNSLNLVKFEKIVPKKSKSVMIVPMNQDRSLVLISEYCAGVETYVTKFPTGTLKSGEDEIVAANRELAEEIGMRAKTIEFMGSIFDAPGHSESNTDVYLAKGLVQSEVEGGDEPEPLEVKQYQFNKVFDLVNKGEITDSRTLAALLFLQLKVNPLAHGERTEYV